MSSQRPRGLPYRYLSILWLCLLGLSEVARPGSPCLAQGARLTRLPHPPAPAANGSSSPALSSPCRRGLGRIKQAEERTQRSQRAGGSRAFRRPRGTLWGTRLQLPRAEANPKVSLQGRSTQRLLPAGAPPAGNGGPPGAASPSSLYLGTAAPTLPSQPWSSRSLRAWAGEAPGPWTLQKPQLVHRCSLHRVTWGRGGYPAKTGTLLSLSTPAPPELSLKLRLLCGARSLGPRSGLFSAPLTATMPPSALRSAVTLPRPPAAPHATAACWSRQGGAGGA